MLKICILYTPLLTSACSNFEFYERVLSRLPRNVFHYYNIIILQKSVAVHLVTVEPREVAVRSLVSPPGFGTQDAVRNARAFLRDARDSGCQLVSDVRLRCPGFARVAGPVRPLGSGLGSLPVRALHEEELTTEDELL